MITLDDFNDHFTVAHDAELEGKHGLAAQVRATAWEKLGFVQRGEEWQGLAQRRLLVEDACVRGIIARGYRPDDCMIMHYPNGSDTITVQVDGDNWTVLTIKDTSYMPPWGGNIGFQWQGPTWPPWKIDPGESDAWLSYWMAEAREKVDRWLARRSG